MFVASFDVVRLVVRQSVVSVGPGHACFHGAHDVATASGHEEEGTGVSQRVLGGEVADFRRASTPTTGRSSSASTSTGSAWTTRSPSPGLGPDTPTTAPETCAELAVLNEIWEAHRTFTDYLLPRQNLVFKHPYWREAVKRYVTATIPHQRPLAWPGMRKTPIIRMRAEYKIPKAAAVSRHTLTLTGQLQPSPFGSGRHSVAFVWSMPPAARHRLEVGKELLAASERGGLRSQIMA